MVPNSEIAAESYLRRSRLVSKDLGGLGLVTRYKEDIKGNNLRSGGIPLYLSNR